MKMETHRLNELHAFRFRPDGVQDAKYALVISHGIGGHGGIYDVFCEHHVAWGAEIWSYDAPGHGRSTTNRPRGTWTMEEWADASRNWADHVKAETGLPVFTLGSSLGVAAAISAIDSPAVSGAITMGSPIIPGSNVLQAYAAPWLGEHVDAILHQLGRGVRLDIGTFFDFDEDYGYPGAGEQKRLDPWNTWSYDLASWVSLMRYKPSQPLSENTKPVFVTYGDRDPNFKPEMFRAAAASIGGPVTVKEFEDAGHQLMLFETAKYSDAVHAFCLGSI